MKNAEYVKLTMGERVHEARKISKLLDTAKSTEVEAILKPFGTEMIIDMLVVMNCYFSKSDSRSKKALIGRAVSDIKDVSVK